MAAVDDYVRNVIEKGDKGSDLLRLKTIPTLKNNEFVDVIGDGMTVLRVPEDKLVVVHSAGGDPEERDVQSHAGSLVENLVFQAGFMGAEPIAFANVVDSNTGDESMLGAIADAMVDSANRSRLAIMNGENAILGARVNCDANVSGTMISFLPREKFRGVPHDVLSQGYAMRQLGGDTKYAVFDAKGLAVYINSDGIGTKSDFHERNKKPEMGLYDFAAMNVDDALKFGAIVKVLSGVAEVQEGINLSRFEVEAKSLGELINATVILEYEHVGNRIRGYNASVPSYNVSGSVVSVIDEARLRNPPVPSAGEYLVAVTGKPNPRSNGITDKRKAMVKMLGEDWHETPAGQFFLEYLSEPSTVLYPIFTNLVNNGHANSVFHMSGGAYNGKLARPLAAQGLYVEMSDLFEPDPRELAIAGQSFTSLEVAYAKWPMGNDGFFTTNNPNEAIEQVNSLGLEAKVVGRLEKAGDKTGVKINTPFGVVEYNG